MNFVAIDFETANSKRSSACSLGIAVVQDGLIVDQAYWLIRPKELYFDPFNTYIHGISEKDVINEPEFIELWPQISSYIENKYIVAHNASFDMSVLRYVLDEYEIPYPSLNYLCSWMISKKHWPSLPSYKLDAVSGYLGIKFNHHNALEDSMACASIIIRACKDRDSCSIDVLINSLGITIGKIYPGGYNPSSQKKTAGFKINSVKTSNDNFDTEHPFYSRYFVFTGTLQSMLRKDAAQKVVDLGGFCSDSVSRETNYLVIGEQDFSKFKDGVKSSKMKKAESLIATGADIEIITENDFLSML